MRIDEFLLARIAEDEAVARSAIVDDPRWFAASDWTGVSDGWHIEAGSTRTIFACNHEDRHEDGRGIGVAAEAEAAHVARHDPARVLAECEAKRAIVEREGERLRADWRRRSDEHRMTWDAWVAEWVVIMSPTLCTLASVYADHPDYDPAWRMVDGGTTTV